MALTKDRNTQARDGHNFEHPVKGGVKLYVGAIVVLGADGFAKPGVTGLNLVTIGRAERQVDNTAGADGDVRVRVARGVYRFDEAAGDPLDRSHIGKTCYLVDDHTVAATNGANTRSAAGRVMDVEDDGTVWVEIA